MVRDGSSMGDKMKSSGDAVKSPSNTWTAGIDVLRSYPYQDAQWHLNAIEFHHKVKQTAEAWRDEYLNIMVNK